MTTTRNRSGTFTVEVSQQSFDAVSGSPPFRSLRGIEVLEYDAANGVARIQIATDAIKGTRRRVEHLLHNPATGTTTIHVEQRLLKKVRQHRNGLHTLFAHLYINCALRIHPDSRTVCHSSPVKRAHIVTILHQFVATLRTETHRRAEAWLVEQRGRIL